MPVVALAAAVETVRCGTLHEAMRQVAEVEAIGGVAAGVAHGKRPDGHGQRFERRAWQGVAALSCDGSRDDVLEGDGTDVVATRPAGRTDAKSGGGSRDGSPLGPEGPGLRTV